MSNKLQCQLKQYFNDKKVQNAKILNKPTDLILQILFQRLHIVRLFSELFDGTKEFIISTGSDSIANSKCEQFGAFHLQKIVPKIACYKSKTKVCLISSFRLVSVF